MNVDQLDRAVERRWTARDWLTGKGLTLLAEWVAGGASMQQIAERIGIGVDTLRRWRATYPELNTVLDSADQVAVSKVEQALFRRAVGYTSEETTRETRDTPSGTVEVSKTVTKPVAPDVTAATFWLKNRAPERWTDRQDIHHTVEVMEQQAAEILQVMEIALAEIGMTTAQRARLPEAIAYAIRAAGFTSEEETPDDGMGTNSGTL